MHHFENVGLYDGLFVMQDVESKTLWNHITGEALYGPYVGRSLGILQTQLLIQLGRVAILEPAPDLEEGLARDRDIDEPLEERPEVEPRAPDENRHVSALDDSRCRAPGERAKAVAERWRAS